MASASADLHKSLESVGETRTVHSTNGITGFGGCCPLRRSKSTFAAVIPINLQLSAHRCAEDRASSGGAVPEPKLASPRVDDELVDWRA
jgi:hypothetical protein